MVGLIRGQTSALMQSEPARAHDAAALQVRVWALAGLPSEWKWERSLLPATDPWAAVWCVAAWGSAMAVGGAADGAIRVQDAALCVCASA